MTSVKIEAYAQDGLITNDGPHRFEKNAFSQVKDGIREIMSRYHLEGTIQPDKSVYRIGGAMPCILKPLKVGAARALAVARILNQNTEAFLPELMKPENRQGYLWYRSNRYLATRVLPGRPADYFRERDVEAAIRVMANWHALTGEMVRRDTRLQKPLFYDGAAHWEQRLREMDTCREMATGRSDPFSIAYLNQWRCFKDQGDQAFQELKQYGNERPEAVICYHDWAFHNVLIEREQAFLIDFDEILIDGAAHDRANLLSRYLRLFHWASDALGKMLGRFDRLYSWKRGEIRMVRLYLTFPFDFWMIGRQYFLEQQPWSRRYFQEQWRRKILEQQVRFQTLKLLERQE